MIHCNADCSLTCKSDVSQGEVGAEHALVCGKNHFWAHWAALGFFTLPFTLGQIIQQDHVAVFVLFKNIKIILICKQKTSATTGLRGIIQGSLSLPHRGYDLPQRLTCHHLKQVSSHRLYSVTLSLSSLLCKWRQRFLLCRRIAKTIWNYRCCISPLMLRAVQWGISVLILQMGKLRLERWGDLPRIQNRVVWLNSFRLKLSILPLSTMSHQVGSG